MLTVQQAVFTVESLISKVQQQKQLITHQQQVIEQLLKENKQLRKENERLRGCIQELEAHTKKQLQSPSAPHLLTVLPTHVLHASHLAKSQVDKKDIMDLAACLSRPDICRDL